MKEPDWVVRDLADDDPETAAFVHDLEGVSEGLLQKWAENYSASGGKGTTP